MNAHKEVMNRVGSGSSSITPDQLVDSATEGWTVVGEGHPILAPGFYATDITHLNNAQQVLDQVRGSASSDPDVSALIKEIDEDVAFCKKRKFVGNWGVPLIVGALALFGLNQPGDAAPAIWMLFFAFLYVISTFVPVYIINRKNLVGEDFNDFGWIADKFSDSPSVVMKVIGFFLMFLLLPIYAVANVYRYWGDEIRARLGAVGSGTPVQSSIEVPSSVSTSAVPDEPANNDQVVQSSEAEGLSKTDDDDGTQPLDAKATALLEEQLPKIKTRIRETLERSSKSIDEYGAEKLFGEIHGFLPLAFRVVIRKKRFVRFCMENRDKLI
jgi:hypothetical protein